MGSGDWSASGAVAWKVSMCRRPQPSSYSRPCDNAEARGLRCAASSAVGWEAGAGVSDSRDVAIRRRGVRRFASRRLRSVTPQRAPALVLLAVTTPEGGYVFLRQPVARLARDVLYLP